jgi:hypothetical protein
MHPDERTAALMEPATEEQPTREMTPEGEPPYEAGAFPKAEPPRPATILDELVARRDEMAREDHELVLDIPGYRLRGVNRLAVRYRYPEGGAKALAAMESRAIQSGDEEAIVNMQIDYLVGCCDEVVTRGDDGQVQRLDPDPDGPPLKFGKRLADLFQIDIPDLERAKARFVCRRLFSPGFPETGVWEGDIVLTSQSQAVQGWLQNIHAQANEEFSGE